MKYAVFFSLLLVGVCSGNTFERRQAHDDGERMRDMDKMDSKKDSSKEMDSRDMKTMESDSQKQSYDSHRHSFNGHRQSYDAQKQGHDGQKQGYETEKRGYETEKQGYETEKQGYETEKRGYETEKRGYETEKQGYETEKQGYETKSQSYDSQRQGYEAQRQVHDSQKQHYDSQSRDYDSQKQSHDSQRQGSDSQQEYAFQKPIHHIRNTFDTTNQDQFWRQDNHQNGDDSNLKVQKDMKKDNSQQMQPDNQRPQAFLGLGELAKNVGDYIRGIFGYGSNDGYVAKVYSNEIPSFVDPLDIGEVNTSFALITTKYRDVQFYGLKNAYQVVMDVDTKNHQIVAQIPLGKVEIKGQYTYSTRPIHNFTIILDDAVYVQTTSYTLKDGAVELGKCSGQIRYSQENSFYDRIGFIAQVLQGQLGKHLATTVAPQVHQYISPKLSDLVERTILDVTQNFQRAQIVSSLKAGVYKIFHQIKEHLASGGNANLELSTPNSQQYLYRHYKANLQSVSLQNIQNFTLLSNKVTYTDTMVHSHINLSLAKPIISAHISYYSDEDAQQHEIHAQYTVDNIHAKFELHKDLSGGVLQLLNVKVYLPKVHISPSQGHYKGDLSGLIESLGSKLQHYVAVSLENFLTSQVNGILDKVNSDNHGASRPGKYDSPNGYSSNGYYESGQSTKGEYSGSGHTDMGQLGNKQNTGRDYSGYNNQQYFGKI